MKTKVYHFKQFILKYLEELTHQTFSGSNGECRTCSIWLDSCCICYECSSKIHFNWLQIWIFWSNVFHFLLIIILFFPVLGIDDFHYMLTNMTAW